MKHLLLVCIMSGIIKNTFCQSENISLSLAKNSGQTEFSTELFPQNLSHTNHSHSDNNDKDELGLNIISISPLGISKHDWDTTTGQDIGICYERISNNGKFGFTLPVYFGLKNHGFYVNPVLKLYVNGQGTFRYAFGPQIVAGTEYAMLDHYDSLTFEHTRQYKKRSQFGIMFNHSLNVTVAHHFYVGADLAFGVILYNSPKREIDGLDVLFTGLLALINPSLSAGIHAGFRF